MTKIKYFTSYKILYMYIEPPQAELVRFGWHYGVHSGSGFGGKFSGFFVNGIPRGLPYSDDFSFNVFLVNLIRGFSYKSGLPFLPIKPYFNDFLTFLESEGAFPRLKPITPGEAGTGSGLDLGPPNEAGYGSDTGYGSNAGSGIIPNPRGGGVLKVSYFDELKTIWNRYDHKKSYTDFELNEFLTNFLRNTPNFNLETYLKAESKSWKILKDRFPNAELKDL